ncbi:putative toxin, partial [Aquimarina sediminis]|uniref:putative toxin n=1 Tax=Aquimarina sediminis TaxID=2070536 RepID=UPI001F4DB1CF
ALGTGETETNEYDAYGFLKKTKVFIQNANASHIENTYAFNVQRGTLTSRTHKTNTSAHTGTYTEAFEYDTLDRLTRINGPFAKNHTYDNYGRITNNSAIGGFAYNQGSKRYQMKEMTLNAAGADFYKNRARQQITYNAFKKPVEVYEEGKGRVSFEYGPMKNRTRAWYGGLQEDKNARRYHKQYSSIIPAEVVHDKTENSYKFVFFNGGDAYSAPIAKIEKFTNGASDGGAIYHLQRDYLGSILNITKQLGSGTATTGELVERRQFGAWGTVDAYWAKNGSTKMGYDSLLDRGYTGHEHFFEVGLIHMNGRMYDPQLGRFLSPDNYIQNPYNTQNYNRYGYVLNNPLMYTDPSGEHWEESNQEGSGWLWYAATTGTSIYESLRGAQIGRWLGTNTRSIGRDISRPFREVGRWFRGLFDRGGEDIGPVITEIPQDYAIGDPFMHSNPGVSEVFINGGVAFSYGQINSVSQMIQGIATIFTDPLSLFTWDTYLGAVSQGLGSVFPTLKTFRTNAEIQRAAATGDINNVFYTLGGIHVDVLTETSSIIPALRGAKAVSTAGKATRLGKMGEAAVGIAGKKTRIPSLSGTAKFRVPDQLNKFSLTEVKNVKRLSLTRQLRDFFLYAEQEGKVFILYTRSNTILTKPLKRLIENGYILRRNIPGS